MSANVANMQAIIRAIATTLDITVHFGRGRRAHDICLLRIDGSRQHTLRLYAAMMDTFPEVDLELFSVADNGAFTMNIAISRALTAHERPKPPRGIAERRARYKRQRNTSSNRPSTQDSWLTRVLNHGQRKKAEAAQAQLASMKHQIASMAEYLDLRVHFSQGRRDTDVVIIHAEGDRQRTLQLYTDIIDAFPAFDLELFNTHDQQEFGKKMAITHKLSEKIHPRPPNALERRSRWRRHPKQTAKPLSQPSPEVQTQPESTQKTLPSSQPATPEEAHQNPAKKLAKKENV